MTLDGFDVLIVVAALVCVPVATCAIGYRAGDQVGRCVGHGEKYIADDDGKSVCEQDGGTVVRR